MSNGGPQHLRAITLDDVQTIIGRAFIDKTFRKHLIKDPQAALETLGLNYNDTNRIGNAKVSPKDMIDGIVAVLSDASTRSIDEIFKELRAKYEQGADGVIRPKCG